MATTSQTPEDSLAAVEEAAAAGKLSKSAAANIRSWLSEARYAQYAPQVAEQVAAGHWQQLDDVFWTVIPFGTGGRRGRMFPIGCNAINDRTIGETPRAWPIMLGSSGPRGTCSRARLPTTRGIVRGILPSCAQRSWWLPASRCSFLTAFAARRSCRSPCAIFNAHAD